MRAPFNGFDSANSARKAINPGISFSAMVISFLPHSHKLMSATLNVDVFAILRTLESNKNIFKILNKIFQGQYRDISHKIII